MLGTPRGASSSASGIASESLSHHLTCCLGRTLCFYDLPKLLFGTLKCLEPLAAPPAVPQELLQKASHAISPVALAAHSVFMTFRNCFLAPSNAWNPSQRLQQCLRDCFRKPLTPSHLLPWPHILFLSPSETAFWFSHPWPSSQCLRDCSEGLSHHLTRSVSSNASEIASEGLSRHLTWRLGRTLCFYDLPKLLFGTLKCLEPLAAPPAVPQELLQKASHAISPVALAAHSVFMTFRNCFLAPSNAWNPSQRLQQCLRDCFRKPLTPSHLLPWPHILFL